MYIYTHNIYVYIHTHTRTYTNDAYTHTNHVFVPSQRGSCKFFAAYVLLAYVSMHVYMHMCVCIHIIYMYTYTHTYTHTQTIHTRIQRMYLCLTDVADANLACKCIGAHVIIGTCMYVCKYQCIATMYTSLNAQHNHAKIHNSKTSLHMSPVCMHVNCIHVSHPFAHPKLQHSTA